MKLYLVAPKLADNSDEAADAVRLAVCVEGIADLILRHLAADPALFAMQHVGEVSHSPVALTTRYGHARVARIADERMLRDILRACGDPDSGEWVLIRSLVTCRAVLYGSDGQAFVCLPHEAAPLVSPDATLIVVEECSHWLAETDWMDGLDAMDWEPTAFST
ncbi:MAG TPA: hypothetical protein VF727_10240 [Allosphingosinicella sp.]|jgi:hypothetical protein